jgi:hypothetical protein
MAYQEFTKKGFSERVTNLVETYRAGSKVLGSQRDFILGALRQSPKYTKSANDPNAEVFVKLWKCGPRKVKMVVLRLPNGKEIPIPKKQLLDSLYPPQRKPRANTPTVEKQYAIKMRSTMRQLVDDQLRSYRSSLDFPLECWESNRRITRDTKFDIDHIGKPFVQIADEWLDHLGLTYSELVLVGPPNLKRFKDTGLNQSWKNWHMVESRLAPVLSSVNRSKGCGDYSTPEHLYGSFKVKSENEIDLEF